MRSWRRTRRAQRTSRSAFPFETVAWRASQVAGEQDRPRSSPAGRPTPRSPGRARPGPARLLRPARPFGRSGRRPTSRGGPRSPAGPGRCGPIPSGPRPARRLRRNRYRTCVRLYRPERAKSTRTCRFHPDGASTPARAATWPQLESGSSMNGTLNRPAPEVPPAWSTSRSSTPTTTTTRRSTRSPATSTRRCASARCSGRRSTAASG